MKQIAVMILALSLICTASGLLMAIVYDLTEQPIAAAREHKRNEAIALVLPPHDNEPTSRPVTVEYAGGKWDFYPATMNGKFVGAACMAVSSAGYSGEIKVMVGIAADDTVYRIVVLPGHKETPGLGARISEAAFRDGFAGKAIGLTNWTVKKDGGDIDGITAATISSRAVIGAVKSAAAGAYMSNRATIAAAGAQE